VWSTTLATQSLARGNHWTLIILVALLVGLGCGLVNGLLIAYGRVVPFIATLAMLAAARGLAEIIAQRRTQIVSVPGFTDFFRHDVFGIPLLVIIFALVAIIGWVVLNRTTFGRRTFAVGGNPEAARLAGVNVKRHTVALYAILGMCCGVAAVMIVARTTTGSSTHGTLYELDAIAAVVIGGTLDHGRRDGCHGHLPADPGSRRHPPGAPDRAGQGHVRPGAGRGAQAGRAERSRGHQGQRRGVQGSLLRA